MSFPPGVPVITITAIEQLSADGTPLNGVILFSPSETVYIAGVGVLEGTASLTVTDGVGASIQIPYTDAVTPHFTYTIRLRLDTTDGIDPAPVEGVSIPQSTGASIDVSTLLAQIFNC